mgnify:FL=1
MSITPGKWKRMGHLIVGEHGTPICSLSSSSLLVGSVGEREANGNAIKEVPALIDLLQSLFGGRDERDIKETARAILKRIEG